MANTAITGQQFAEMSSGRVVMMDSLSQRARNQVLDAARLIADEEYDSRMGNVRAGCRMALYIFPRFQITYGGGSFGVSTGVVVPVSYLHRSLSSAGGLYVAALPGDWQPQESILTTRAIWLSAATADTYSLKPQPKHSTIVPLPNPPSLEEALKGMPEELPGRMAWLRQRAFHLLAPLGERWLARDTTVPFSYRDFAEGRNTPLDSLPTEQREWAERAYAAYAQDTPGSPQWAGPKDVRIRLSVEYLPTVIVVERMTNTSDVLDLLQTPDITDLTTVQAWKEANKHLLRFAPGTEPPLYVSVDGKGDAWTLQ